MTADCYLILRSGQRSGKVAYSTEFDRALALVNVSNTPCVLAKVPKCRQRGFHIIVVDDDHHADTAIKRAQHFFVGNVAVLGEPVEYRALLPGRTIDNRMDIGRIYPRQILADAATGDVRQPFDRDLLHQREDRLDVDARRREQRLPGRSTINLRIAGNFEHFSNQRIPV